MAHLFVQYSFLIRILTICFRNTALPLINYVFRMFSGKTYSSKHHVHTLLHTCTTVRYHFSFRTEPIINAKVMNPLNVPRYRNFTDRSDCSQSRKGKKKETVSTINTSRIQKRLRKYRWSCMLSYMYKRKLIAIVSSKPRKIVTRWYWLY